MSNSGKYDAIVIGSGKGGKILATYLGKQNHKVALIERDPMMIGGGCIDVACIPTKTFIAGARIVQSIRRPAEFGIKVEEDHRPNGWSSESDDRKSYSTDPRLHDPGC